MALGGSAIPTAIRFSTVVATDLPMSPPTSQSWRNTRRALAARALVAVAAVTCCLAAASAREQAEEFVAGLRERGLHELALDYLSQMETSRLADAAFRERIPYHRGVMLIAQARQTADHG